MLDLDPKDYVLSLSTGDDDPIDGTFSAFEAENDPGALDEVARWKRSKVISALFLMAGPLMP